MAENALLNFLNLSIAENTPKVSIYMPTNRGYSQVDGDKILFKNLVSDAEKQLKEKYKPEQYEGILKNLNTIYNETVAFWRYNKEGLVLFAWEDKVEFFRLRQTLEPVAIVEESFHVIPLFAYYIDAEPTILVNLSRDRVSFYQVDRFSYEAFEPEEIHTNFNELYDDFDAQLRATGSSGGVFHGFQTKSDELEKDRDIYFKYLNTELTKLSRAVNQKIILAGTSENVGAFKKIAKGSEYYEKTIDRSVEDLSDRNFKALLEDYFSEDSSKKLEDIQQKIANARNNGLLLEQANDIEDTAVQGMVQELYVDYHQVNSSNTSLDYAVELLIAQRVPVTVLNEETAVLDTPFAAIKRG